MTPKEKAEELIGKANIIIGSAYFKSESKQIALFCVEEILNGSRLYYLKDYDYWEEVKKELNLYE